MAISGFVDDPDRLEIRPWQRATAEHLDPGGDLELLLDGGGDLLTERYVPFDPDLDLIRAGPPHELVLERRRFQIREVLEHPPHVHGQQLLAAEADEVFRATVPEHAHVRLAARARLVVEPDDVLE